jgi:hypothetical protein
MDEMVTGDLESQNSNNGGANGSSLVATMILHPMVRDLAFSASNKAQNRVLKQAAALKRDANTKFRNKFRCMQAEKRARELESTLVQVTKALTPQIVLNNKCRPVLNAGSFVDVSPDLTPGHCSYGGHAWVVDSCLGAKGRTLVSVRYALEGTIEKHIELTQITPVQIPQHARVRPPKRTTVATMPPSTEESMTRNDHVNKPIKVLLQSAYSANKGPRWRRKQLGLMDIDMQNDRFRQCLLSDYVSLKAYLLVAKGQTQIDAPNQHRKRGNDGQWAS